MNRIRNKDHRTGTYEINKISLSCFDDKIFVQENGYDGLEILEIIRKKNSYLNNYFKNFFCRAYYFSFQSNQDSFFVKHVKFEKRKALIKELNEELMSIAWHPKRWWDFCVSEN